MKNINTHKTQLLHRHPRTPRQSSERIHHLLVLFLHQKLKIFATHLLPIHARWFHTRLSFIATVRLAVPIIQLNDINNLRVYRGNAFGADEYAMFGVSSTVAKDVGAKVFSY